MLGVMVGLFVLMVVFFLLCLFDIGFFNVWWEMVFCLIMMGVMFYDVEWLVLFLYLWCVLVGWMGGLFMLVVVVVLLVFLCVGGFEIMVIFYGCNEWFECLLCFVEVFWYVMYLFVLDFCIEMSDFVYCIVWLLC